jgi:hypothetical protein
MVLEVVVTVTVRGEAVVALTIKLAGDIEQFAPMGAPVQERVVCPPTPAPPTLSW